jgi:hypothetical protein
MIALPIRVWQPLERMRQLLRFGVGVLVVVPVDHGVIEPHAQTLRARRRDDFTHQVAVQLRARIVVASLRVVQREPVVMFARENDIAAPRFLRERRPLPRKILRRLEQRQRGFRVRVGVGFDALLDPLHATLGRHRLALPGSSEAGVQPPMHKHPEPRFAPPCHPRFALGRGFRAHGQRAARRQRQNQ